MKMKKKLWKFKELNYEIEEIVMKIKWIEIWKWRKNDEN